VIDYVEMVYNGRQLDSCISLADLLAG